MCEKQENKIFFVFLFSLLLLFVFVTLPQFLIVEPKPGEEGKTKKNMKKVVICTVLRLNVQQKYPLSMLEIMQ